MNDIKRVILVTCGAVVFLLLCLFIKNHADTSSWETAYKYKIAIVAEKEDQFNYDVDSKQGLVLSRGEFETKKGTKFDEMKKTFTYVEKVHEHYTMHTETYKCGKSTCVRTYWTWDWSGSEEKSANIVTYFGRDYSTKMFKFNHLVNKLGACSVTEANKNTGFFSKKHGCKEDWGGEYYYQDNDDRYYYNAVPLKFTASFLADTSKNLTNPFGGRIPLETKSPEQLKTDSTSYQFYHNLAIIIASIIILVGMAVLGYSWVMQDGKWSTTE
jgi:hypothetical protein